MRRWKSEIETTLLIILMVIMLTLSASEDPARVEQQVPVPTEHPQTEFRATEKRDQTLAMEITAYCLTGSRTASGTWPKRGTISADPRILPFGTRVYIPGYGYGTVDDTGGDIKGYRLDVYLPSRGDCIRWGRRTVEVTILE